MRVFLIGSKELGCHILDALVADNHQVLGVFVRDNEPGMAVWHKLGHRSLAAEAEKLGIPVYHDMKVNSPESLALLQSLNLDIILSCFWSEIFKEPILNLPKLGVFNFHTAYLPKNRGSRPIPWAIIKGEPYAGITVHKMLTGVDNGPIVAQSKVEITATDTGETVYNKVIAAGRALAKKVISDFANNSYTLTLQDESQSTYQPRGEPFGRQINAHWTAAEKDRYRRAFDFPPFDGAIEAPATTYGGGAPKVYVLLGFDCDRPRGIYAFSEKGTEVAKRKFTSLQMIKTELDALNICRSYFISGQFLDAMGTHFGKEAFTDVFKSQKVKVEIGDHTYHHEILRPLPTRPDKKALTPQQLRNEIRMNTVSFQNWFGNGLENRGLRSPLGYFEGMRGQYKSLDVMQREGMRYISTDLRDENHSLHPKLRDTNGKPRQPYRYENGLLEIPAMGWQDTVFSGLSTTPLFEDYPKDFESIIAYFARLFKDVKRITEETNHDYFLGLTLHPLDNSYCNENRQFFPRIKDVLDKVGGGFLTYGDVCDYYDIKHD